MRFTGTTRTTTTTAPPALSVKRDWKLIEYLDGTGDVELYHLVKDLREQENLFAERKGKAADLKNKLRSWRADVIARMPIPNPGFDPKRAHEWWSMRTGKPIDSDNRKRFPQTEKNL